MFHAGIKETPLPLLGLFIRGAALLIKAKRARTLKSAFWPGVKRPQSSSRLINSPRAHRPGSIKQGKYIQSKLLRKHNFDDLCCDSYISQNSLKSAQIGPKRPKSITKGPFGLTCTLSPPRRVLVRYVYQHTFRIESIGKLF